MANECQHQNPNTQGYTHAEVNRLRASVDAVRLVEEQGKGRLM